MIQFSEYVSLGHPDKIADYISSYLLDRYIERDPATRYAVEVQIKNWRVTLGGEVSSKCNFTPDEITAHVRAAVNEIGYTRAYLGASAEERMIASLARRLRLPPWEDFKLIYFYTMTYHIPSALRLLLAPTTTKQQDLVFRTDRRYVRCNGAYDRLLKELNPDMLASLLACTTTEEAYNTVRKWFFFGRYAAFLFLEVYCNCFRPDGQRR